MADRPMRLPSSTTSASHLLTEVLNDASGQVSSSVYDTARLVASTPWLLGHTARVDYLLARQTPNGTWGGPGSYTIVPTLSATEALLTELHRPGVHDRIGIIQAADNGLAALQRMFEDPAASTPDTIAVEFVVPALVKAINMALESLPAMRIVDVPGRWIGMRLELPASLDPGLHAALLHRLECGLPLPNKTWAALEAFGASAISAQFIRPSGGAVAGSPSATAGWLGPAAELDRPATAESARYLTDLQTRSLGAVPAVAPITYFEPAWVLNSLAVGQVSYEVPPGLLDRLEAALGPSGAPAGPGLPADADDTAGVLSALARHGRVHAPDVLMHYQTDGYFACFPNERTPSVSTNAHVLEALVLFLRVRPGAAPKFRSAVDMAAGWLLETQRADGSWLDKWHASPYYATACSVVAFTALGDGRSRHAIESASRWVLGTRRVDGSWGRWGGTIEETSYAVQILLLAANVIDFDPALAQAIAHATASGAQFLRTHDNPTAYEPLWHAKDLYAPSTVIRAARLAALRLYDRRSISITG